MNTKTLTPRIINIINPLSSQAFHKKLYLVSEFGNNIDPKII